MNHLSKVEEEVPSWPRVSAHPHRFGGKEFRFGRAEIGHVHRNGVVDIPFPRPVRDLLLSEHLAEEHHHVPDSGWITFQVRNAEDANHAVWLFRLSYLRYVLKTADDARGMLDREAEALHLDARLKSLFEPLIPRAAARSLSA